VPKDPPSPKLPITLDFSKKESEEPLKINQVPSVIHEIQPGKMKKQRKNSVSLEYTPEIQQA
jgi:hypothetical protein